MLNNHFSTLIEHPRMIMLVYSETKDMIWQNKLSEFGHLKLVIESDIEENKYTQVSHFLLHAV